MLIPPGQEFRDGVLQILHPVERAPTHPLGGQLGQPALDQIKPTGTGRHQVGDEARMPREPSSHLGVWVSPLVVHHQVPGHRARKFLVETAQESPELLVPMTRQALPDDPAREHLQGRQQRGRALALIVVGQGPAAPLLQGQARRRAVPRLNLALLIHANHQRQLGRIQLKADHVGQLFQKLGIARQLEALHPGRLHLVTPPDVADGGLAHPLGLRQQSATPRGHPRGLGLQGRLHDGFNLLRPISRLAPASRGYLPPALQAALPQTGSPQGHGLAIGSHWPGGRVLRLAFGCRQDDAAPERDLLGCSGRAQPLPNLLLLAGIQSQSGKFSGQAQA